MAVSGGDHEVAPGRVTIEMHADRSGTPVHVRLVIPGATPSDETRATIVEAGLAMQSLELRMEKAALEARRRWPALDGTLESMHAVERIMAREGLADAEVEQLAAYVGETLRRLSGAGQWRVTRRRVAAVSGPEGCLRIGHWEFDPYDLLQHFNGPLMKVLDEAITYFESPTEATAERLGWKMDVVEPEPAGRAGPWTELRDDFVYGWHHLQDWNLRRRARSHGGTDGSMRAPE